MRQRHAPRQRDAGGGGGRGHSGYRWQGPVCSMRFSKASLHVHDSQVLQVLFHSAFQRVAIGLFGCCRPIPCVEMAATSAHDTPPPTMREAPSRGSADFS